MDETRGKRPLEASALPGGRKRKKQNTRNQRPTCPVYVIAVDVRLVWETDAFCEERRREIIDPPIGFAIAHRASWR